MFKIFERPLLIQFPTDLDAGVVIFTAALWRKIVV